MALRQVGEAPRTLANGERCDRIAADPHRAVRRKQPRDGAQQGRLAGAVGAEQGDEGAPRQCERDVIDDGAAAELDPHVLGGEEWRLAHARPPPRERRSRMIR